jgi:hypothetical protein
VVNYYCKNATEVKDHANLLIDAISTFAYDEDSKEEEEGRDFEVFKRENSKRFDTVATLVAVFHGDLKILELGGDMATNLVNSCSATRNGLVGLVALMTAHKRRDEAVVAVFNKLGIDAEIGTAIIGIASKTIDLMKRGLPKLASAFRVSNGLCQHLILSAFGAIHAMEKLAKRLDVEGEQL